MLTLITAAAALAQQASPPVPPAPPAPPLVRTAGARRPNPSDLFIVRFRAGEARCGGGAVRPLHAEEPLPSGMFRYAGVNQQRGARPERMIVQFNIDSRGRPLGIVADTRPLQDGSLLTKDVVPAFAAWQFQSGEPRSNCEISFDSDPVPVGSAELPLIHRYLAMVHPREAGYNWQVARAAFDRAKPASSTCYDPPPPLRRRDFPAFDEMEQPAGRLSYSFLTFDVDPRGRPVNVRLASSSGHAQLDAGSRKAIAGSRFAPAARQGCVYYYFLNPSRPLEAPPATDAAMLRPPGSTCSEDEEPWQSTPELVFPAEFRRRSIEGWAILRHDVAPWGEVGNAEVAAAEPASAFGQAALPIVRGSRRAPSPRGDSGCMGKVRFEMQDVAAPEGAPGFD